MAECLKCGGKGWRQGEHWQYTCVACNGTGKSQQPQQQPPPQPSADAAVGVPVPTPAEQTLCPGEDLRECGPAAPTDAATCLECGGKGEVDSGGQYPWGEWINVPCPTCQRQQDSNEWTPSGSMLPERFVSVTEPPQPQQDLRFRYFEHHNEDSGETQRSGYFEAAPPQPQQEPLSPLAHWLREATSPGACWSQTDYVRQELEAFHPEDRPKELVRAVAELLHHQEQQVRAEEQARVLVAIEATKDRATIWRDKHGPETKEGHAFEYQRLGYEVLADFLRQRLGGEG